MFNKRLGLAAVVLLAGAVLLSAIITGLIPVFATETGEPETSTGPAKVAWPEAEATILTGEVWQVAQHHSLEVTLYLHDGREIVTTEPSIDKVFQVIGDCGAPCSDVVLMTE